MNEAQVGKAIVTFVAIPLILIIALYLIACIFAPLINLNNQTFRIIFTIAGGTTTLFFIKKTRLKERKLRKNVIEF